MMLRWVAAGAAALFSLPIAAVVGVAGLTVGCDPASGVPIEHDGDVLATIIAVADSFGVDDRVLHAAVAAAIVESGLTNVDHGHLDSLGVFQQRPSKGWGTAEQVMDPAYAATAFFAGSTAAGSLAGGGNVGAIDVAARMPDASPAELAQAVQQSAFPGRYADVADQTAALLTGVVRSPAPSDSSGEPADTSLPPEACVDGVPPTVVDGMACPLPGSTFTDTWHAPRSGGRLHKGTDLMAAYGTPVYASHDGVVRLSMSRLGGRAVHITDPDTRDRSYSAHLSGWRPGLTTGDVVQAGELVGYNGASGNAALDAPHVHFQWHPSGGAPVNPYVLLRRICSEVTGHPLGERTGSQDSAAPHP